MRPADPTPSRGRTAGRLDVAVWRRAAAAGAIATAVVLGSTAWLHTQDRRHREALLLGEGRHVVTLEREFLEREIRALQSDLRFLARQPLLQRLLAGEPGAREALGREYAVFARSKPLYDQIRFLDPQGDEVVRVNRRGEEVEVVGRDQLQSKAARYYFREAIGLAPGEVFVSPLDLNVERGRIERPLKPVVRLATPVTDGNGTSQGLLVLNYAGTRLLGELREIAGGVRGDLMLLDQRGDYLQAPDPERAWGGVLGHAASFRDDHPRAWQRIREAAHTQARIGDELFTAERVPLGHGAAANAVFLVSRIPLREAGAGWSALGVGALLAVLASSYAAAGLWARATVTRREQERRIAESESRLRILSSRLLAAQEEERRGLSRLLHDELGQQVTAVALDLKSALRPGRDAASRERSLRRAAEEVEAVLAGIHELATRVRPSVLDDLGLMEALESHLSDFEERTGIEVARELQLVPGSVPGALGENVYRIVQEALSNVASHACCDAARLELRAGASQLELRVEDAGCGFDPTTLEGSGRLGVLGMRERVELLGGEFQLDTAPGRGTRIHVWLPLPEPGEASKSGSESEGGGA